MVPFDYENPWHRYVNLYCCIACDVCETEIPLGVLEGDDLALTYELQCVRLSDIAENRGWKALPDGWSFQCPECVSHPTST